MKGGVALSALVFLALAGPALAVDGAREISQVCAVNGGCFAGDAGGFPVTINQPGSYVLTTDLELSNAQNGIEITTSDVALDLNGFTVRGTGDGCLGTGIVASSAARVSVQNGRVTDFGSGVELGGFSRVERVVVEGYGSTGIRARGLISDCDVSEVGQACFTGETGIDATGDVVWNRVSARLVAVDAREATIRENEIKSSGTGIQAYRSQVSGNSVRAADSGIVAVESTISGNSVFLRPGCLGAGISASSSQLTDNAVRAFCNGLSLDANSGYSNNTIVASVAVTGGVDQGGNACNGSTSC